MIYGKIGEKNFKGIVDGIKYFCKVESTQVLGYRDAAILRVCCDAQDKQIYDIDVAMYIGDRYNAGSIAAVKSVSDADEHTVITMLGRRVGLNTPETLRAHTLVVKKTDFIGFTSDNNVLCVCNKDGTKLDILIKLRLRDIYTQRLNNITERIANCLLDADETLIAKVDIKWSWTKKLICLASLECLLRVLNLWDVAEVRNECRNEAVIKLMLSDLLYDGIDGLDEYNMYSNDAKQRVIDSDLLYRCGKWLVEEGGQEVAVGMHATDVPESSLVEWKHMLEADLGVILPALNKQGMMRKSGHQKLSILA